MALTKSGKTLIVKSKTSDKIDLSSFDKLTGLLTKSEINQHNSLFLIFDSIQNAEQALVSLSSSYNVKYSYYKVFISLSKSVEDFDKAKNEITSFVEKNTDSSVLYFKIYRKNNVFMNCGYFVVDTIDGMKKLISKESELKQFKTESLSGTFYRFNNTKYNSQNTTQTENV